MSQTIVETFDFEFAGQIWLEFIFYIILNDTFRPIVWLTEYWMSNWCSMLSHLINHFITFLFRLFDFPHKWATIQKKSNLSRKYISRWLLHFRHPLMVSVPNKNFIFKFTICLLSSNHLTFSPKNENPHQNSIYLHWK